MSRILMMAHALFLFGYPTLNFGCDFKSADKQVNFVRLPEDTPLGSEILRLRMKSHGTPFIIRPVGEDEEDFFSLEEDNKTETVSIRLSSSLEGLVDCCLPRSVLRYHILCNGTQDSRRQEPLSSDSVEMTVFIEDINDHSPQFIDEPYAVTVDEMVPIGTTLLRDIYAMDMDKPGTPNSDVMYTISGGNDDQKFRIEGDRHTSLVLNKQLDYDNGKRIFVLYVTATDKGLPAKETNTTVVVTVEDSDDLPPKFTREFYTAWITETTGFAENLVSRQMNVTPPVHSYDQDKGINASLVYEIVSGNEMEHFSMDPQSGELQLNFEIDREKLPTSRSEDGFSVVRLNIRSSQKENSFKSATAVIEVRVIDVNDNVPIFEADFYNISVMENLPHGFSVLQVLASDKDLGENGDFSYEIIDSIGAFNVHPRTGWLTVGDSSQLDRERFPEGFSFYVAAREKLSRNGNSSMTQVMVTLLDANDNRPTFIPSKVYRFPTERNVPEGNLLGQIGAVDPDLGSNGFVKYEVWNSNSTEVNHYFSVDPLNGQIKVKYSPLPIGSHLIFVEASDQPDNPLDRRSTLAAIYIDVISEETELMTDEIITTSSLVEEPSEFWVANNASLGYRVGVLSTKNMEKKKTVFKLAPGYTHVPFSVDNSTGEITVSDDLSLHSRHTYSIVVTANDGRTKLVRSVFIRIVDPSERSQREMKNQIEFHVRENMAGVLVGYLPVTTMLPKRLPKYELSFIIMDHEGALLFAVSEDGGLYIQRPLDREEKEQHHLTILVENKRLRKREAVFQVIVVVTDENDNPPVFQMTDYDGKVRENSPEGTNLDLEYPIIVTDADVGSNSLFTCTIFGEGSERFNIQQKAGKVSVTSRSLDREEKALYLLKIVARDKGGLSSEVRLTVHVEDVNDNVPRVIRLVGADTTVLRGNDGKKVAKKEILLNGSVGTVPEALVDENIPVGQHILSVFATDRDVGFNAEITYQIQETVRSNAEIIRHEFAVQYFSIHPLNGEITVMKPLPAETFFEIKIIVTDSGGLSDSITLHLKVIDVNNNVPIFLRPWYVFYLPEGSYSSKEIGRMEAIDADFGLNAQLSYYIRNEGEMTYGPFTIHVSNGSLLINGELDWETCRAYNFRVIAKDDGLPPLSSHVDVEIKILDVNDNAPIFYGFQDVIVNEENGESIPIYVPAIKENITVGSRIAQVYANDSDSSIDGNGIILFKLIAEDVESLRAFHIDSQDGIITYLGSLNVASPSEYKLRVTAVDMGKPSRASEAIVLVKISHNFETSLDLQMAGSHLLTHYEVEVQENIPAPIPILSLDDLLPQNDTKYKFFITEDVYTDGSYFHIDDNTSTLYLMQTPDREVRPIYTAKLKLHPERGKRSSEMGDEDVTNEIKGDTSVKVVVIVKDVNDHAPYFVANSQPIIGAVREGAPYGEEIIQIQAYDDDEGLNADLRYEILGRTRATKEEDDTSHDMVQRLFDVNPVTGIVHAMGNFAGKAGIVYGFDVKASDLRGAQNANSAIVNVFVHVIDDDAELIMSLPRNSSSERKNISDLARLISASIGVDLRIRTREREKINSFHSSNDIEASSGSISTLLFMYAADPQSNVIIDPEELLSLMEFNRATLRGLLGSYELLRNGVHGEGEDSRFDTKRYLPVLGTGTPLRPIEIGVVLIGCVVFAGASVAVFLLGCLRCPKKGQRTLLAPSRAKVEVTSTSAEDSTDTSADTLSRSHNGPFRECSCSRCYSTQEYTINQHRPPRRPHRRQPHRDHSGTSPACRGDARFCSVHGSSGHLKCLQYNRSLRGPTRMLRRRSLDSLDGGSTEGWEEAARDGQRRAGPVSSCREFI